MTGLIRTIGGDLPADLAGPTYVHEHLIIDTPLIAEKMEHIHLPSVDEAAAEVRACVAAGVRMMVDAMPAASGRDPERLTRVSIVTGMRVVATTGLHTEKYYGDVAWTREETPEELATRFVADVEEGIDIHDYRGERIDRTEARAGIVKVASLTEELSDRDRRLFEAAAITHAATGVPILTHTEGGKGGMNQIEALVGMGVSPERVALSHTDKIADAGYHLAMLEAGVFLCYDQALRDGDTTIALVSDMIESGFGDRILLGTDGARRSLWATLGGSPGLAALYQMVSSVFDAATTGRIFVANPGRFLSLDR